MPLSATQFELLELNERTRQEVLAVHAFLKNNIRLAFTPEEVAEALKQDFDLVSQTLEKFDDLDVVLRRSIGGQRFFRYLADLPEV